MNVCPDKTRRDLEFDKILSAVRARCRSEIGRERPLPFLTSAADVRASLALVEEAKALLLAGEPLPQPEVPDVRETLRRSRVSRDASLEELVAIRTTLRSARDLRRFLGRVRDRAPKLAARGASPESLEELLSELDKALTEDGELDDAASVRLGELRQERAATKAHLERRLRELVVKYADILSDAYFTERDGRHVLPVRADAHTRFVGIVHATSAGGGTLFVEPRVLLPLGNQLKVLTASIETEEAAIRARLMERIGSEREPLGRALEALQEMDHQAACAALAVLLDLRTPTILDDGEPARVELFGLRHPILRLDGVDVVPSDLSLRAGHGLVLSGPNAGGKTVGLKAVGLSALMIRVGLPIPAKESSSLSLFRAVLTDVGDDQSLQKNLSTFSAHIDNLASILRDAQPGVMVLLDEVASGTDPREGEALAMGLLEALLDKGAAVAVTTHYERLKSLAATDDRFENASVGFDLSTLRPTFRIHVGVPGPSSALAVASQFGIPADVLRRAEKKLAKESLEVSKLLRDLEDERHRLLAEGRRIAEQEARLRADQAELERTRTELRDADLKGLARESEGLMAAVKQARETLRQAEVRLKTQSLTSGELGLAQKDVDRVARLIAMGGPVEQATLKSTSASAPRVPAANFAVGAKVYVPRLRLEAQIMEVLPSGQLRVAAGPMKLLVSRDELESPSKNKAKTAPSPKPKPIAFDAASDPETPIQTPDNTVDLRGLRAHEAMPRAEQFLDEAIRTGRRVAFLIHGHGTGALRQTLRDELRSSGYVERMRPGGPREGGDGVTVVWLR